MTTATTIKAAADKAEKANAYVLRLITNGCTHREMVNAQAARDAAEASWEALIKLDAAEAAFEAARYAPVEAE